MGMSLFAYVIICVCHYLRMSLFTYVIICVCHYLRMSLFPYVIISVCHYFHMTKTTTYGNMSLYVHSLHFRMSQPTEICHLAVFPYVICYVICHMPYFRIVKTTQAT